jgi:CIC family chloride channel protein
VVDADGQVQGVLTRRSLLDPRWSHDPTARELVTRVPLMVREDHSLREAADHMLDEHVGRLIVISHSAPHTMVGIITRGAILAAHARRLKQSRHRGRHIRFGKSRKPARPD